MLKSLKIVFLFFVGTVYGQEEITGKIIDSETGAAIPYVNIGIKDRSAGTVSDKYGNFKLNLNANIVATNNVTFSHLGYGSKDFPVSNLINKNNIIELDPSSTELEEVVVHFKAPKAKKIGRKSVGLGLMHANFYSADEKEVDDRLGKEMGMIFNINKSCKVDGLLFNITTNQFKYLKFRVNFYRIDKRLPSELINTKDIFFEVKGEYMGWYEANFADADVYLDSDLEKVGVTIQWVESVKEKPESKFFLIATATSTKKNFIIRDKNMDKWKSTKFSLSFYLKANCVKE